MAKLAPWIPTPVSVVYAALEAAWAGPCDVVYDLGSGDGRVVVIAARDFCVEKAVGVEIDPALVEVSKAKARMEGVADRVEIIEDSFFNVSLRGATLVFLYLYKSINEQLRPKLEEELEPGARVVTIDFPVPGWLPVRVRRLRDESDILRTIHVYVIGISDTHWARRGIELGAATSQLTALTCRKICTARSKQ
ncbi:50S ribosomal protein L11 methyltransferase [Hyperthermus butylicus]|uniref:Methylase n=1 Tax=Hyperthermus butylicus (strain DSM 5456 / JCM 9403 / PLM1-5) TaxID=415426 RepID=A2BJI4_HYPBU|nr:class I SAM-dependent methyltransferase [Hyperthermus butylicus]ABM80145.1 Methylase [Hyperthermus butylicus DSM 5456]